MTKGAKPRPKLVVIVGSGMSQALGVDGTDALTGLARKIVHPNVTLGWGPGSVGVPLASLLWKALAAYYDAPNFETMLHATEALVATNTAPTGARIPDVLRPVSNAFMDVTPRWKPLADASNLKDLASNIVGVVADRVADGARKAVTHSRYGACKTLIERLLAEFEVTIIDLNYDDILDAIVVNFEDGFEKSNGGHFDWKTFMQRTDLPRLLHVHGSIRFGVYEPANRPPEIVRYLDAISARPHWGYIIDVASQSGDRIFLGPIISGLRKADKTLWAPYGHYVHNFISALFEADRVLAIGYGGNDLYINQWLLHWYYRHGASAKYSAVTKFDDLLNVPNEDRILIMPGAVMGFATVADMKKHAAAHPAEYKHLTFTHNGGMIDGNGLPEGTRLDSLVSFLK